MYMDAASDKCSLCERMQEYITSADALSAVPAIL